MHLADLSPLATLGVAVVALVVGLRTIAQRDRADRRDQWWERARWATDLTLSPDVHARELGFTVLEVLAGSELAGGEELDLLDVAVTHELARRPELLDDGWHGGEDDRQDSGADSGQASGEDRPRDGPEGRPRGAAAEDEEGQA